MKPLPIAVAVIGILLLLGAIILGIPLGTTTFGTPLNPDTLERLVLSAEENVQLQPGQTYTFTLGVRESCCGFAPVKARVFWEVSPTAGARINLFTGVFTVDKSVPSDSSFRVIANVEEGRRVIETKVHVYTLASNPLVGTWREISQIICGTKQAKAPTQPIEELRFWANGSFSVTWTPFEMYRDYWGVYTYHLKSGSLHLTIEQGSYIPLHVDTEGTFLVDEDGRLILNEMWLGSYQTEEPKPNVCRVVFSR